MKAAVTLLLHKSFAKPCRINDNYSGNIHWIPFHSQRGPKIRSIVPPGWLTFRRDVYKSPPWWRGCPLDLSETKPTIGGSWDGRDTSLIYVRPRTLHNHFEIVIHDPRPRSAVKIEKKNGAREGDSQSSGIFVVNPRCAQSWWKSNKFGEKKSHENNRVDRFNPRTCSVCSLRDDGRKQPRRGWRQYSWLYVRKQRRKLFKVEIGSKPGPNRVGSHRKKKRTADERGGRTGWQYHRRGHWWCARDWCRRNYRRGRWSGR